MGFSSFVGDITGGQIGETSAERGAKRARAAQERAGQQAIETTEAARASAQGFLSPFGMGTEEQPGLAQQGLNLAGFIGDPQAQFDFLQNNPLFNLALENANRQTQQAAASQGRLSAGDTLQQLSNNVLLSASPLIGQQTNDIFRLLGLGQNAATAQANTELGVGSNIAGLQTDIGSAVSAGETALANARGAGSGQMLALGNLAFNSGQLAGFGGGAGGGGGVGSLLSGGQAPGGFGAGAGGNLLNPTSGLLPIPF